MKMPLVEPGRDPVETISPRTTTAVLVAIALFFYFVRVILLPFVIAGAIAYACTPLVDGLARRTRAPRSLSAVLVFLVLLVLACGLGYFSIPPFIGEFVRLSSHLGSTVQTAVHRAIGDRTIHVLGQNLNAAQIGLRAVTAVRGWLKLNEALPLALWGFAGAFGLVLTLVLLFYFLLGGPHILRGLFWLIPPKQRPLIHLIWIQLDPVLRRYFVGIAVVVVYASSAAYIGLGLVLGIHHAVLLALLTGLLELIPVIGPGFSAVIAGLVALRYATSIWNIIAYSIYATVLRLSIDQLIGPIVLGRAARVHPVLIMFCFLAGGLLFGIAGVIMAVPVALAIKIVLATLYEEAPDEELQEEDAPSLSQN